MSHAGAMFFSDAANTGSFFYYLAEHDTLCCHWNPTSVAMSWHLRYSSLIRKSLPWCYVH